MICHKRANEDACAHLACIKKTGKCLKNAGVNVCHMPPAIVSVDKTFANRPNCMQDVSRNLRQEGGLVVTVTAKALWDERTLSLVNCLLAATVIKQATFLNSKLTVSRGCSSLAFWYFCTPNYLYYITAAPVRHGLAKS